MWRPVQSTHSLKFRNHSNIPQGQGQGHYPLTTCRHGDHIWPTVILHRERVVHVPEQRKPAQPMAG